MIDLRYILEERKRGPSWRQLLSDSHNSSTSSSLKCPSDIPDADTPEGRRWQSVNLRIIHLYSQWFSDFGVIQSHLQWNWKCSLLGHVQLFVGPWTVAHQVSLSMGFSRQEYWSGLPFSSPENLPDPGIEPRSPKLQADSLLTELFIISAWIKMMYVV